jgi:ribonuclease HI
VRVLPADPGFRLIVACDGAARGNPGPAGIGVHVTDDSGHTVGELARGIGVATNNVAEYTAAIEGLRLAKELGAQVVLLRSDSRLLIEQLAGRFKVRNTNLQRLHAEAMALVTGFASVTFEHVPRELNVQADRLANVGVDDWLAEQSRYTS